MKSANMRQKQTSNECKEIKTINQREREGERGEREGEEEGEREMIVSVGNNNFSSVHINNKWYQQFSSESYNLNESQGNSNDCNKTGTE